MNRRVRLVVEEPPPSHASLVLDAASSHHLLTVLRARVGQEVELLDGRGGRCPARVAEGGRRARLETGEALREELPALELEAWLPLIKPERLEWAVEKLTELGVATIRPFTSEHTGNVRRPPDLGRLSRVVDAALEQSGNPWRPALEIPRPLADLLAMDPSLLVAHPGSPALTAGSGFPNRGRLALLAGPEGGFAPQELEGILKRGPALASLGPHVVRAETALVALAAVVRALTA